MRGFVREQLLRFMQRWDERGHLWRANPRQLSRALLASLSGARLPGQERLEACSAVENLIRHRLLLDHCASDGPPPRWPARLSALGEERWRQLLVDPQLEPELPEDVRFSFPGPLHQRLLQKLGPKACTSVCRASNELPDCTFLRMNPLTAPGLGGRSGLVETLRSRGHEVEPCGPGAEWGLRVQSGRHSVANQLPEYFDGKLEVQDESSQIVAGLVQCGPDDLVVDLCCGAGGKALALLGKLGPRGRLVAHEPRRPALRRAARRLDRAAAAAAGAGVATAEVLLAASEEELTPWLGRAAWVLVDAPCSNSGSLRRHPECKYRLFEGMEGLQEFQRLQETQRHLLGQASKLLSPGGRLIYSTCSLLQEENEAQAAWAEVTLGLRLLPQPGVGCFPPMVSGRDGYFAAVLASSG